MSKTFAPSAKASTVTTWTANQTFNDNVKAIFGTGGDASVVYDGTNLIITPDDVGSGYISLNGDTVVADGHHLLVGHTSQITGSNAAEFQVLGTDAPDGSPLFGVASTTDGTATIIQILKNGNADWSGNTSVANGEDLGTIRWLGADGTDYNNIAVNLSVQADAAVGTAQVPGRLRIQTADSSGTLTEAARVNSQQNVLLGATTNHGTAAGTNVLTLKEGTAPTGTNSGNGSLYVDTATNVELYYIDSAGNAQQLSTT